MEILTIAIINTLVVFGTIYGIEKIKNRKSTPKKSIIWYELT